MAEKRKTIIAEEGDRRKTITTASGDAPAADEKKKKKDEKEKEKGKSKTKIKADEIPEGEELPKTESQLLLEEQEYRAMLRKQRFKRHWPEITKVKVHTRPWRPPPPPQRMPPIPIDLPELTLRHWVPPYRRRRRHRPRLPRIPPEEMTQQLYECAKLKKKPIVCDII